MSTKCNQRCGKWNTEELICNTFKEEWKETNCCKNGLLFPSLSFVY